MTDSGITVIAGTAGGGKTSLALRWAHQVKGDYPDGQLYVNLRGYDPGEPVQVQEVLHRFLVALGTPVQAIPADVDAASAHYRSLLADRRVLVLLDNAATVGQVRPLLPGSPGCLAIVTSRDRLSGLAIREGAHRLVLNTLNQLESVALLRAITTDYRPKDDADKLAELARLCAGLPLALRIAAERAVGRPHMQLDDLIASLRDESAIWETLSMGDEEEADAVRTVFAWSYQALPERAARLFRQLGMHPGPDFGIGAAAALAARSVIHTRQLLDTLVRAHLLEETAPDRYEFHDLLRAYASWQAQTEESPEERTAILRRVLAWYQHTADAARILIVPEERGLDLDPLPENVSLMVFRDYDHAVDWTDREHANLIAAVRASEAAGLDRFAWQLATVHWRARRRNAPVIEWLATAQFALTAARRVDDAQGEAELLDCLAKAHALANQATESQERNEEALAIRRRLHDREGEGRSLNALGLNHLRRRQLDSAGDRFEQAIVIFEDIGSHWAANVLSNLALVRFEQGHLTQAARGVERSLAVYRAGGREIGMGTPLRVLSEIQRECGEREAALRSARESVDLALTLRNRVYEGQRLITLGNAQQANGQFGEALESYHQSATIHQHLGDRSREALAWYGAGETYRRLGRHYEAASFHRQAATAHRALGDTWHEAVALEALAAALEDEEQQIPEQPRRYRTEALRLVAEFDDLRAVAMRRRLQE
ncbi:NB-ARC domain-containing protein [Streptomyces niveus]|uniref:ATP-binding protein n=1 Tax=Streptomyces niveus TaxID=193462 RepID=UPI0034096C64